MIKKWTVRVLLLAAIVFIIVKTGTFFGKLSDGTYRVRPLEDLQREAHAASLDFSASQEVVAMEPETVSEPAQEPETAESVVSTPDTKTEEVKDVSAQPAPDYELSQKTGNDFYMDLGHSVLWQSGEYDKETGEKVDNKRRVRYPKLVEIDCPEYRIQLTEGYKVRICEYDADKKLLRSKSYADGDTYFVSKEGEFFSLTLYKTEGEKSLSFGQWNALFEQDLEVVLCTEQWLNYSVSAVGDLIENSNPTDKSVGLSALLLNGQDDELADYIWQSQIASGIYTLTGEEINNGNTTFYVSSSTGDDKNSGLDPDNPKKTFAGFSGMSDINVLLKCGDTFPVSKGFKMGSDCIYAAYGEGSRPVLDFYRELEVSFAPSEGLSNVWEADLSGLEIANGKDNKDNCNIGQLLINDEVNWKRYVWSSKEEYNRNYIKNRGNGAWAVDWKTSMLYLYSESDPNNYKIKYAPPDSALTGKKIKNTVIKGLEVKGTGAHACNLLNCENITVSCCYFNHIGGSVHTQSGMRYGNATQVWDTGKNITVDHNFASWIFDTCFTNQGSDKECEVEHVHFTDNIGAHFYWGIEVWGDGYSHNPFNDVTYTDNVLFDNIDLTNPNTPMQAGSNTRPLETSDKEYVSYRTGYKYHQMSAINASNSGSGQITKIENNIVWNSNRFLVQATNSRKEETFSALKNNVFYAENVLKKACLFRYIINDEKHYLDKIKELDSSNKWSVHFRGEEYDNKEELALLEQKLGIIAGR